MPLFLSPTSRFLSFLLSHSLSHSFPNFSCNTRPSFHHRTPLASTGDVTPAGRLIGKSAAVVTSGIRASAAAEISMAKNQNTRIEILEQSIGELKDSHQAMILSHQELGLQVEAIMKKLEEISNSQRQREPLLPEPKPKHSHPE